MTDRELLIELVKDKRRLEKTQLVRWGINAAVIILTVVLLTVYLIPTMKTVRKADAAIDMMQEEVENIKGGFDDAMEKLSEFKALADKFSGIDGLDEKLAAFDEIGEKIRQIDFEAFNNVITSFENLVNKVPWLFK